MMFPKAVSLNQISNCAENWVNLNKHHLKKELPYHLYKKIFYDILL